jgi:hypothetical protein
MLIEIQTYRTQPGQRERFIELFERVIVPSSGISIAGQFRSLDDQDTFVWIRAIDDQAERIERNDSFFFGSRWTTELSNKVRVLLQSWDIVLLEPTEASRLVRLGETHDGVFRPA